MLWKTSLGIFFGTYFSSFKQNRIQQWSLISTRFSLDDKLISMDDFNDILTNEENHVVSLKSQSSMNHFANFMLIYNLLTLSSLGTFLIGMKNGVVTVILKKYLIKWLLVLLGNYFTPIVQFFMVKVIVLIINLLFLLAIW